MPFVERFLTTREPITVGGRQIKRYHVNIDNVSIEPAIEAAAEAMLPRLLPELDGTPAAAFIVLHRGRTAAYLIAYSWVWDNVIECHAAAAGEPILGCPDDDPTHFSALIKPWIGCVWELPPLAHERSAWVRHLLEPDTPDLASYLSDVLPAGPIGGAR